MYMDGFITWTTLWISVVAFGVSATSLWLLLQTNSRLLAIDVPNARSLHGAATPRGGGVSIGVAFALCAAIVAASDGVSPRAVGLAALMVSVGVLGWLDDHLSLTVRSRLVAGAAVSAAASALVVSNERWVLFGGEYFLPIAFTLIPVALSLIWIKNLVNFMDGADGLVGLHSVIINIVLSHVFWVYQAPELAVLSMGMAGAVSGFLLFNWAPAKVFLGDSGSLILGMWLGLAMTLGASQYGIPVDVLLVIGGVLFFDATFTLLKRILKGEKFLQAHREHLYQRLVLGGWSHARVAVVTGGVSILLGCIAEIMILSPELSPWLFCGATAILALFTAYVMVREKFQRARR